MPRKPAGVMVALEGKTKGWLADGRRLPTGGVDWLPACITMGALGSRPVSDDEVRAAFNEMDVNKDATINATELKPVIQKLLNRAPSRSEVTALIQSVDDSADGILQFDEFLRLVRMFEAWGREDERLLAEVS